MRAWTLLILVLTIATAGSAAPPKLTQADLHATLDRYLPAALARGDIAGATIVVVRDGKLLLAEGFGFADVATHRPVDPLRTGFRLASVTKLFTWIAIMQRVERGHLDLDRDINAYLDFHIAPFDDRPVTLRDLMTHSAGFDEHLKKLFVDRPERLQSLSDFVKAGVPRRIYRAGDLPSYSNYGAALAAYIVERTSGEPFESYVDRHVLRPGGMARSTLRQPLPPDLAATMASGYLRASGPPLGFEWMNNPAGGGMTSNGQDMARFMILLLGGGGSGDHAILRPDTLVEMQRGQNRPARPFQTMGLGFLSTDRNGVRVVGHDGDLQGFKTVVYLLPEQKIGIFFGLNSAGIDHASRRIRTAILHDFIDRYFPRTPTNLRPIPSAMADGRAVAGLYRNSRASRSSIFAIRTLRDQDRVALNADGTLTIDGFERADGRPERWIETAPFRWSSDDGNTLTAVTHNGKLFGLASDEDITTMMLRVPWWEARTLIEPATYLSLIVLAFAVLGRCGESMIGPVAKTTPSRTVRWLDIAATTAALFDLLAAALIGVMLSRATDVVRLDERWDAGLILSQGLLMAGTLGVLLSIVPLISVWRAAPTDRYRRWRTTFLSLGLAVFATIVNIVGLTRPGTSF